MTTFKYYIPEIPNELLDAQSKKDQSYLDHIRMLEDLLKRDFATGLEHREEHMRATQGKKGVVIFIDGDNLKKINDIAEDHAMGDLAIKKIAHAIATAMEEAIDSSVRSNEKANIARLGGDEFSVFIPNVDSLDVGKIVAERILNAIRKKKIDHPKLGNHQLTASIGVGLSREDADKAMYLAKQKGRNRVEVYSSEVKTSSAQYKYHIAKRLYKMKHFAMVSRMLREDEQ